MVIMFCLTGKAQRFANCKICAPRRAAVTLCALSKNKKNNKINKNVPLSCQNGWEIAKQRRYHPEEEKEAGISAEGRAVRAGFGIESRKKQKEVPDCAVTHKFNELWLFVKERGRGGEVLTRGASYLLCSFLFWFLYISKTSKAGASGIWRNTDGSSGDAASKYPLWARRWSELRLGGSRRWKMAVEVEVVV